MIRFTAATQHDLPALTELWQLCFGDDAKLINAFWQALFGKLRVFCAADGKKTVAFLCAMPTTLVDDEGGEHPTAYLYAVCTAPAYRRRGISSALMRFAENALQKDGFLFTALVPAEESLFDFYAKQGYRTACYHRSYTVAAGKSAAKITPIHADAYRNLRQMQLYGSAILYPLPLLEWQESVGGLYRVETADTVCCAAAEVYGDRCICKELLPDCPEAAAALAAKLGCTEALVRTDGVEQKFGMLKPLQDVSVPEMAYLGLAFD